jgi:PRTRC genetic system protein B
MKRSVNIYSDGDATLNLTAAVLVYASGRGDVYSTVHPIDFTPGKKKRPVLGAGVPMSKANLASFAAAVSVATAYEGFVPDNLLFTSPNMIAWWVPAAARTSWFHCSEPEIGVQHGAVAHPALVFVATPGAWYVFALRKSARPGPATRLCHAPHFNVYDGGNICTGNVSLPPVLGPGAIAQYEDAFFRSRFTHSNRSRAIKYPGGMNALWRDQLAKPDEAAMHAALVTSKETLQAAITRIATTNSDQHNN